jgi:DNA repair exonuclease SbcCD ATPase subunit
VQDRQEALVKEEKERAESYEQKLKDLQAREEKLAKREEQDRSSNAATDDGKGAEEDDTSGEQAKKEADIQGKLDDLRLTEQKVAADRAALDKLSTDLAAERKEFQQRVKEFEDAKLSAENDALQAKKNLEQQDEEMAAERKEFQQRVKEFEDAKLVAENDALQAKKNLEQRDKEMVVERKGFQQRVKEFEDARSSAEAVASQAKKSLEQRQKELENQMTPAQKKTTPETKQRDCHCIDGGVSEADLQRKQRENARLEQRLAKLEKQLSQMCAASILSEKTSKANGMAGSTVFSKGTGTAGCGYKHYKPPRKLNRKLIGMVYE